METFAPVLVPTLNRYTHFAAFIDSLSKCTYVEETELIVALDYPQREEHWSGYLKIKEYIQEISCFKTITIIERGVNYGAEKNVFDSITEVFKNHDRLIFSEDDNTFSSDFLAFVNKGLEIYEKRQDIFSISGYQYPLKISVNLSESAYLWQGFSAWGVGIWKDKWEKVGFEKEIVLADIRKLLRSYTDLYRLSKIANHYLISNLLMLIKEKISGDGRVCLYQYYNDQYSLFPIISRVRNMGHDGSGTGCGTLENDIYAEQSLYTETKNYYLPKDLKNKRRMNRILYYHFKRPKIKMFKAMLGVMLVNTGLISIARKYVSSFLHPSRLP
jgi:hypothetical protein